MLSTIALFSGSRRHGNTGQLIDRIAFALNIEIVDLARRRMSSYDYEHLNRNDDFEPLMRRVLEHDQIIFATPIYWYAVSPTMKVSTCRARSGGIEIRSPRARGGSRSFKPQA